jgi:hypothetical protein
MGNSVQRDQRYRGEAGSADIYPMHQLCPLEHIPLYSINSFQLRGK